MRLNNPAHLFYLIDRGLPRPNIGLARSYLGLIERLKKFEQTLNFLKRCRRLRIFPPFILHGVKIRGFALINSTNYTEKLLHQLRYVSLNQHIKSLFGDIQRSKVDIRRCKQSLYYSITDQFLFHLITTEAEVYGTEIKDLFKYHFKEKIDWILHKHYPRAPDRLVDVFPVLKPSLDRVTVLDLDDQNPVNLSNEEKQILAYGPKFAVTPKVDEKLLHQLEVDIGECAYKVKWKCKVEETSTTTSTTDEDDNTDTPQVSYRTQIPFKTPFITPPPDDNILLEAQLRLFRNYVVDTVKAADIKPNLSHTELEVFNNLKKRTDLHYSKSDKCGDFVVTQMVSYRDITQNHIDTNPGIYKYVAPTRKSNGRMVEVRTPTETTYRNQITALCTRLEEDANKLWGEIAERHDLPKRMRNSFLSHHSNLPTMYCLIKTHKVPVDVDPATLGITDFKARPIVSCCGGPTEKLAWVISHIIKPLLGHVPCHLSNIHAHLEMLRSLSPEDLNNKKFYSADISALYTNLSIQYCIQAVLELAEEHWVELHTFGLGLTDLHKLLELIFMNSYFTFDQKIYWQCEGLFMGCSPSAGVAVLAVYKMERNSIYIDTFYLSSPVSTYYTRYMDDNSSLATNRQHAQLVCDLISDQDPHGKIKWEIDFPENDAKFTPYLDTEIRVDKGGILVTRYFRKPQDKGILLNARSHHPQTTKDEVIKNLYRTAVEVSSGPEEIRHSVAMVNNLAIQNGYRPRKPEPRTNSSSSSRRLDPNKTTCKLPYISEEVSNKIRGYIKKHKIPVRPVFYPGRTLGQALSSSRPLDKRGCTLGNPANCTVCPVITNGTCGLRGIIYRVDCKLCPEGEMFYEGETYRPCHDRFREHIRSAADPSKYPNNSIGKHYADRHRGCENPQLNFSILDRQSNTIRRKISEAVKIVKDNPNLNERDELASTIKFLINR